MAAIVGIDPGSHTLKVLSLKVTKNGVAVQRFGAGPAKDGAAALAAIGIPLRNAVAGLAGRDMNLRYTQVPPSPDWQLRNLMDLEIQDLASQSGGALSADYNILPIVDEEGGTETVLMALARNEALERVAGLVASAGGNVAGHVPNCIALYNAYLRCAVPEEGEPLIALACIGHETMDVALVRGHDLLFARNLGNGTKVLDDAIASAFNVSPRKAESLKHDLLDLDPASRGKFASGQAEKVTMAAGGAANVLVSAIQSSVAFCQSQTKIEGLRLDKVLLCGGGARLRGVRGMMRESLRCPVEIFDPFEATDLSALPAEDAEQLDRLRAEAVIALGLALTKADPELYALEILPESVKRRQRFFSRTIYNIGAGVIGAALLGLTAMQGSTDLQAAADAARRTSRLRARVETTHDEAAQVIAATAAERAVADVLAVKAVPLNGLLRTMRVLRDTLPPELWITAIEVRRQAGRRSGSEAPVIEVQGDGKPISGRDVGTVYRDFTSRFKAHELIPANGVVVKPEPGTNRFTFTIDFLAEAEAPAAAEEGK
jgi:type IV pilus assembly protein PilM